MALTKCKECSEEISKKAKSCPKCGAPAKKKTSMFTWLVVVFVVLSAGGFFSGKSGYGTNSTASSKRELSPKQVAMKNLKLDYAWKKGGFDNVMLVDFKIANNSQHQIKDIQITCTHYAKSGTKIDSNERTIFEIVPAKGEKAINKFNMGLMHSQAAKSGCRVTDLKV